MSGNDYGDRPERERRSWREIDQMRDGTRRSEPEPRGRAARARADEESKRYRKDLEKMFDTGPGGAEGRKLAQAMRDAHGSPELVGACRAYRDGVGPPTEAAQVSLFLDSGDPEMIMVGLEALGAVTPTAGLKSQLRLLAQGADDAIAEAAEELLERL